MKSTAIAKTTVYVDMVPPGSIMPYIGKTAPEGWLLCNGSEIPDGSEYQNLKNLLGTENVPNLQGMFIRGTGTNDVNYQSGPDLNTTQEDTFKKHNHQVSLTTSKAGAHNHTFSLNYYERYFKWNGGPDNGSGSPYQRQKSDGPDTIYTNQVGNHTHSVSGSTMKSGSNETRPVNYGVNYIIKY